MAINIVTIYKWVSDHLRREALNDQAFHMPIGLAQSASKRVRMIVKRTNILSEQNSPNIESMIFLENMWADSMSTIDNLLAAAKTLKPKSADILPRDSSDLLKMNAMNTLGLRVVNLNPHNKKTGEINHTRRCSIVLLRSTGQI